MNHSCNSRVPLLPGALWPALLALCPWTWVPAHGQTTAPPEETAVKMGVFEVQADSDASYGALNSNSITSFNTELAKLAISADIFDQAFMDDVAATSVEDMFQKYSPGSGMTSLTPEQTTGTSTGSVAFLSSLTLRGVTIPHIQRDGLMALGNLYDLGTTSPYNNGTTNFDLERVEVIKGPQALLYAGGGAGGVLNAVSKQARFGKARFGTLKYQVDSRGSKTGQIDFGDSKGPLALRFSIISQNLKSQAINVGSEMNGYYTQFAYRPFANTIIRIQGEQTTANSINTQVPTLGAGSAALDSRQALNLRYLLVTGQAGATDPATGRRFGTAGSDLLNGSLNLDNVGSLAGWLRSSQTINAFGIATVETHWNPWLSSLLSLGYNDFRYDLPQLNTFSFFSPTNPVNTTGKWAVAMQPIDQERPGRNKAIRYTLLAHNVFFHGRADSQSILGADYNRADSANITYQWFQADGNWNPMVSSILGTQQGRTTLAAQTYPIDGVVKYPLWAPRSPRVTIGGVNYLRMMANIPQTSLISADNVLGLNGTSQYAQTKLMNKGLYFTNYTDWFGGKFTTMAGARLASQFGRAANITYQAVLTGDSTNYNFGLNYKLRDWLRPYVSASSSYQPPISFAQGPYGKPAQFGRAQGGEAGVKFSAPNGAISGSLAYYHTNAINESMSVSATIYNDVNPAGLNGRAFGTPSNWINVNRETSGLEAVLTASPTPNWRLRFSASKTSGTIQSDVVLPLYYNDQFRANAAGQIAYADGTLVYINPAVASRTPVAATAAGAVPLTVAILSDPSSLYYANPINPSGAINPGSTAFLLLSTVDPAHGAIATGATGLPIRGIQINTARSGFTPPEALTAIIAGEQTAGYPTYAANITSMYTWREGWMKGFKLGGTVVSYWRRLAYYYYPNIATSLERTPFYIPSRTQLDPTIGYDHRFRRVTWSVQLNVYNLFNHYEWILLPSSVTGWRTTANIGTAVVGSPRSWGVTSTIGF